MAERRDHPEEDLADRFDHPVSTIPLQGPHSDHWPYVQWGVPGHHVTSETGSEGRGWGHTDADTLDTLESRYLREQSILLSELVVDLAERGVNMADEGSEVAHEEPEGIAAALEDEDRDTLMKLTGEWPYDELELHGRPPPLDDRSCGTRP